MPPRDQKSEGGVKSAEACGQKIISPGGWGEDGKATEEHEANAHDGDDGDGERASGDDAGAVE